MLPQMKDPTGIADDDADQAPVELIGDSEGIRHTRKLIERVAQTDASVLITGESGVGKEMVAAAIHSLSHRRGGPFVAINCAAIPESLVEAELFGHEKGSFTGAIRSRAGVFERAAGGTLFLDEIAEMSLDMQTRLLRVLETRRMLRVGGRSEIMTDARIVSATNRDLATAVTRGRLRRDLVYRLAVFPIEVPPLRTRGLDAIELAERFLVQLNHAHHTRRRFCRSAYEFMLEYDWPGNVRELRNCVERAYILCSGNDVALVSPMQLPVEVEAEEQGECVRLTIGTRLVDAERQLILATLDHFAGDKRRTADALGCSLKTIYNKLNHYRQCERASEAEPHVTH